MVMAFLLLYSSLPSGASVPAGIARPVDLSNARLTTVPHTERAFRDPAGRVGLLCATLANPLACPIIGKKTDPATGL